MRRMGLLGTADAPFSAVSEGEQRMLLIARALVKQPLLLIFDEPCQGLDAGNRDQVLRTIDSMGQHLEASVLYVTHQAGELPKIISHVMRLEQGRIVALERLIGGP
jgi:molybdate transport system ATP-binding protein